MSDSMVERVASAILAKVPESYGMTALEAREYARAAIEAMREPTETMLRPFPAQEPAKMYWETMIDVALGASETAEEAR